MKYLSNTEIWDKIEEIESYIKVWKNKLEDFQDDFQEALGDNFENDQNVKEMRKEIELCREDLKYLYKTIGENYE